MADIEPLFTQLSKCISAKDIDGADKSVAAIKDNMKKSASRNNTVRLQKLEDDLMRLKLVGSPPVVVEEDSSIATLKKSLLTLQETNQVAYGTLDTLKDQGNRLRTAGSNLDKVDSNLDASNHILRKMGTWWRKITT